MTIIERKWGPEGPDVLEVPVDDWRALRALEEVDTAEIDLSELVCTEGELNPIPVEPGRATGRRTGGLSAGFVGRMGALFFGV